MMKKTTIAALMLLALALVWGCGGDDDGGTGPGPTPTYGSITGVVEGGAKSLMSGATITVGTLTTTSNEQGYFALSNVPIGDRVVHIVNDGYLSVHRVVAVQEGVNVHMTNIYLTTVESQVVSADTGGTAATGDGNGSVVFGANAFEDASGNAYTGDVTVELVAMLPSDEEFYDTFPGEFSGVREDGTTTQFVSFGFMGVNLFNADKSAPIQLADGQTAALSLTVGAEFAKSAPATIPMWWFDETAGVWREEGEAVLNGDAYEADVSHFTTWNWDLPISDVCTIEGTVVNNEGDPVANARVIAAGVENALMDDDWTDAEGHFSVRAVKNANTDVWAVKGSYASAAVRVWVGEECPVVVTESWVLIEPAFSVTLAWGDSPNDLDSHLWIPASWIPAKQTGYYHVYYGNMGTMATDPYTMLDTDDTSYYGPEIISSSRLYEGTYEYWVRDYSEDNAQTLHDSDAVVQLELGGVLRLFDVTTISLTDAPARSYWHVFDFTVDGQGDVTVTRVMRFQDMLTDGPGVGAKLVPDTK